MAIGHLTGSNTNNFNVTLALHNFPKKSNMSMQCKHKHLLGIPVEYGNKLLVCGTVLKQHESCLKTHQGKKEKGQWPWLNDNFSIACQWSNACLHRKILLAHRINVGRVSAPTPLVESPTALTKCDCTAGRKERKSSPKYVKAQGVTYRCIWFCR